MTAIVGVGDFTGDGKPDLLARDSAGTMWLYAGNGKGGAANGVQFGTGWNIMTNIVGVGDMTGDGHPDLLATDNSGNTWLYAGNGKGGAADGVRVTVDSAWGSRTSAIVGVQ
jgi:sugar lactone lactonase YvrE